MLRLSLIFFLCCAASLLAWRGPHEADVGFGAGYARNSMSWKFKGAIKQSDRDLNSLVIDAFLTEKIRSFYFAARTDVGWTISGKSQNELLSFVVFHSSSRGFFADGEAEMGYMFTLWRRPCRYFRLIPEWGYGAYYQFLKYHYEGFTKMQRLWYGPFVGGDLSWQPSRPWAFSASYGYYFLWFRQKTDPPDWNAHTKQAHGHRISGKIRALVADHVHMNLFLRGLFFTTGNLTQKETPFKAWWHSFESMLEVEYFF